MASFEAIFATADAHDLRLNSFAQLSDGLFRVNFRIDTPGKETWFAPVSEHADPRAALEAALETALARLAKRKQPEDMSPLRADETPPRREEAEAKGLFD